VVAIGDLRLGLARDGHLGGADAIGLRDVAADRLHDVLPLALGQHLLGGRPAAIAANIAVVIDSGMVVSSYPGLVWATGLVSKSRSGR
jgi:hypothetical protein